MQAIYDTHEWRYRLIPGVLSRIAGRALSHPSSQPPFPERSVAGAKEPVSPSNSGPKAVQSPPPVVLSIAGYDPSAGAGVLADLKTFSAAGVYGMACITALTVQSTRGVRRVIGLDPSTVIETLDCLAEDVRFEAIKVGMLGSEGVAKAVMAWLEQRKAMPVVLDPVVKSSSGKDLLDVSGCEVLRTDGLARAGWITPNLTELAILTGSLSPATHVQTENAARQLQKMSVDQGNPALKIVVTGGHADTPDDLLLLGDECHWFPGKRIETKSTHGTGCTFSSALTARIALGDGPVAAVQAAKDYVTGALRHAYPIGTGKGPVNHSWEAACNR
ncbi:MAG: bifunctional hydroxymethylpyrimidine kinase/phosphomethylpyrimidine kinase [Acidobacteriaceae bacterium]